MSITSYEMQGLTWQAKKHNQQDAILINNKVIQHKGLISKHHVFSRHEAWCVAVADGVSSSRYSDKAAIQVLQTIGQHFSQHTTDILFADIQNNLCQTLADSLVIDSHHSDEQDNNKKVKATHGASTTMTLLRYSSTDTQDQVSIQSLGDSRAYAYCRQQQQWTLLTRDDNFYEELLAANQIQYCDHEIASSYFVLMEYFCADWLHNVPEKPVIRHQLETNDAVLVCTDGVFDALAGEQWPPVLPDHSIKEWLNELLEKIRHSPTCGDNVSMVLVRALPSRT
jgi:PPM family protein phosphatase